MSTLFCLYLIDQKAITPEQLTEAMREQLEFRLPIGEVALRRRMLTLTQVFTILRRQSESGAPFGRIACELGFLKESQLAEALFYQAENDPPLDSLLVKRGVLSERDCRRHRDAFQARTNVEAKRAVALPDLDVSSPAV